MSAFFARLSALLPSRRRAGASDQTSDQAPGEPDVGADKVAPAAPAPIDLDQVETGVGDLFGKMSRYGAAALGAFVFWAVAIPLDSAVTAPGAVVSDGKNKMLQSRTGGRIAAIFVHDGQKVAAGERVITIDPVEDQANLTKLRAREATLLAMKARLEAEKSAPSGSSDAAPGRDPLVTGSLPESAGAETLRAEQEREFEKGRAAVDAEVKALRERADGLKRKRVRQLEHSQLLRRQIALLERQLTAAQQLVRGGHIAKQQAWDIESRLIEKRSEYATLRADIETGESGVSELDAQVRQTTSKDARITSQQLTEVLGELGQIGDQIRAAQSAIAEKTVVAPEAGRLVRWTATTLGAVVKPGDVFGEVVPEGAQLEVQLRVAPKDITSVVVGQKARVKISAQALHNAEPLPAEVTFVSADSTLEERTQERHFEVRVKMLRDARSTSALALVTPGMTGDAMLLGPSRSFASYMIRPIIDGMKKSFGEQ